MDLLELIQQKVNRFAGSSYQSGLEAIVHHIEVAEKHHERAIQESNEYLFTDVIYRTNHAFEGILKEAYTVLTSQDPSSKNPYQIEKYLEKDNILRERVAVLLRNYRVEWRNPSTHDHRLFFSEQEAFLAIVSICAFMNILLDQLIEKAAFDREKEEVKRIRKEPTASIQGYESLKLWKSVVELLKEYSARFPRPLDPSMSWNQSEKLGGLAAFIHFSDKKISINREVSIVSGNVRVVADMVLEKGKEKVILELKRARRYSASAGSDEDQVFTYLTVAGIEIGILYFAPDEPVQKMMESEVERKIGHRVQKVVSLYPREA